MKELRRQFVHALIVIWTIAAIFAAGTNFQQQKRFHLADDGAAWADRNGKVVAAYITPGGPADRAGIRVGDQLVKLREQAVRHALEVPALLNGPGAGPWSRVVYTLHRGHSEWGTSLTVRAVEPPVVISYQYGVAVAYLLLGLFVYFRRGDAPMALHFYVLCLLSFVAYSFHYTAKLNAFDRVIYWGNIVAGLLAPASFLHFCVSFPRKPAFLQGRTWLLYLPALLLLGTFWAFANGFLRSQLPLTDLRYLLDRVWMALWTAYYLLGGAILVARFQRHNEPVVRQQLLWLCNGVLFGVLPFITVYAVPYVAGVVPNEIMQYAVLTLSILPITWGYAVVRYRLLEVDAVFQQGYLYNLATIVVLGAFFGLLFSIGKFDDLGPGEVMVLILVAAFVFQPIRNYLEEVLDRHVFYKERYERRQTLIQFARELNAQTELTPMLDSVADRLVRALSLRQVAFFLQADGYELLRYLELDADGTLRERRFGPLTLDFLSAATKRPYLFFESTYSRLDSHLRDLDRASRDAVAALDLTYYLPCLLHGQPIAYIGLGRTVDNDFLAREDIELLTSLCGYVGIAIENARLYESLQRKAEQIERLKEFSENIVESINVGIAATDFEDRVESWNHPLERLTGIQRADAIGHRLSELLPAEIYQRLEDSRAGQGVQHVYKQPLKLGEEAGRRDAVVNLAVAPLVSKDGAQIGRLVMIDDVTDRHELERRLVQADKLSSIGLLAAGVAHEVNTPLAVISTYAQMLAKQVNGDQKQAALAEKIAKQTFRASEIVNSLLNFSRTAPTDFVEVDLNRLLRDTVGLVQHQLDKAGLRVQWELQEDLTPVKGNPGKLQQVFLNLVLNARDAMQSGGALTLVTRNGGGTAKVEIRDTGHGMDPDTRQKIFDPFFTTKGIGKGTGLGLSVSYGIVQEHAGTIEADSAPGQGTCFRLEFPLARKSVHA